MHRRPRRKAKRTLPRTNTIPSGAGTKPVLVSPCRPARMYADLARTDWSRILSSQYPSSPSLIAAYASLKGALAAPNADLLSYASRIADAILRALDTIHLFLFSPSPDAQTQTALSAPLRLSPEHIDSARIALASPLLMYVLRTALHTLVRTAQDSTKSKRPRQRPHTTLAPTDAHARVDKVLDHLLERVLLSLLRALAPLCFARLAPLLSASLKKDKDKRAGSAAADPPKKMDVRTDVFALIGMSLEALDALPPLVRPPGPGATGAGGSSSIASGIRDRLGLETIRELEALYAVPPPSSSLQSSSQPPQATPSEPPLSTPTPTPLSAQPQPQPRTQQRVVTESRAKRLERLAGTRPERVRALATRDAGWFLASTLNLCVTPAPPAGRQMHASGAPHAAGCVDHEDSGTLLREALLARIGKLVRSVPFDLGGHDVSDSPDQQPSRPSEALDGRNAIDSKFAIDPVCQNMLLAICERAMSYLVSS
jgi:hypothetical protein